MITDQIADMLTRVRNALAVKKQEVILPSSKAKVAIANLLLKEGWIKGVEEKELPGNKKELRLHLKYDSHGKPVIRSIKRISRPSLRIYAKKHELPKVQSGYGVAIISTSKGLMTNKEAERQGQGGEVICELY